MKRMQNQPKWQEFGIDLAINSNIFLRAFFCTIRDSAVSTITQDYTLRFTLFYIFSAHLFLLSSQRKLCTFLLL